MIRDIIQAKNIDSLRDKINAQLKTINSKNYKYPSSFAVALRHALIISSVPENQLSILNLVELT